ncbi:unnamed protein product [Caenorhabditis auriculariae]|uniref:Phorbol-ester/DAG-type domain-containing protein n=1 Tax=Caenorhabditis auriculariae TaxID=2777116 RepID=A0A8S1GRU9_9PELO|nr:unnamed protein product [Caenorhabditis auriculariae]
MGKSKKPSRRSVVVNDLLNDNDERRMLQESDSSEDDELQLLEDDSQVKEFPSTLNLLREYEIKVPEYKNVLEVAQSFSDAHVSVLQQMLHRPHMKLKQFYISFVNYVFTVQYKLHPNVVKYFKADTEELRALAVVVIKIINTEIHQNDQFYNDAETDVNPTDLQGKKNRRRSSEHSGGEEEEEEEEEEEMGCDLGYRLALATDEESGHESVLLLSEVQSSKALEDIVELTGAELNFWWLIVDEMMHNFGEAKIQWVHDVARTVHSSLTPVRVSKLLQRLCQDKWIKKAKSHYSIQPRTIAELSPFLRREYDLPVCSVCNQLVIRSYLGPKCEQCNFFIHKHCWEKISKISQDNLVGCPKFGCGAHLDSKKVDEQVKENVRQKKERTAEHSDPLKFAIKVASLVATEETEEDPVSKISKRKTASDRDTVEDEEMPEVGDDGVKVEEDSDDAQPKRRKSKGKANKKVAHMENMKPSKKLATDKFCEEIAASITSMVSMCPKEDVRKKAFELLGIEMNDIAGLSREIEQLASSFFNRESIEGRKIGESLEQICSQEIGSSQTSSSFESEKLDSDKTFFSDEEFFSGEDDLRSEFFAAPSGDSTPLLRKVARYSNVISQLEVSPDMAISDPLEITPALNDIFSSLATPPRIQNRAFSSLSVWSNSSRTFFGEFSMKVPSVWSEDGSSEQVAPLLNRFSSSLWSSSSEKKIPALNGLVSSFYTPPRNEMRKSSNWSDSSLTWSESPPNLSSMEVMPAWSENGSSEQVAPLLQRFSSSLWSSYSEKKNSQSQRRIPVTHRVDTVWSVDGCEEP